MIAPQPREDFLDAHSELMRYAQGAMAPWADRDVKRRAKAVYDDYQLAIARGSRSASRR